VVACDAVNLGMEQRVRIRIWHVHQFPCLGYCARNALAKFDADHIVSEFNVSCSELLLPLEHQEQCDFLASQKVQGHLTNRLHRTVNVQFMASQMIDDADCLSEVKQLSLQPFDCCPGLLPFSLAGWHCPP